MIMLSSVFLLYNLHLLQDMSRYVTLSTAYEGVLVLRVEDQTGATWNAFATDIITSFSDSRFDSYEHLQPTDSVSEVIITVMCERYQLIMAMLVCYATSRGSYSSLVKVLVFTKSISGCILEGECDYDFLHFIFASRLSECIVLNR